MEIWQSLVLGIVQGITEWLPISSSGHLVLFQELFGLTVPLSFDILLHFSTLLVLFVFYYKDLIKIVMAWLKWDVKSVDFKLGLFLIIGTIPIGLIGVLFGDFISSLFGSLLYVGIALIFTGVVLFLTRKIKHGSKKVSLKSGILVGLVQMFAILPGVSRSGMTISSSLILGISREEAARFSFMLAIPAILGATILEGGKIIGSGLGFWPVAVGMISSFVVGYLSLKWLLGVISRDGFWKFGYYVIALGGVLVVVSLI